MPDAIKLLAQLSVLPPEEAVKYMQQRGLLSQTFDWRDLWHEEHAHQFTVSRLARLDLLHAIHDGILGSVKGDVSRRDFMRGIKDILVTEGWWGEKIVTDPKTGDLVTTKFDANRLKLIYDVNTRQSYAAGQWQRIKRNQATSPYIRYITKRDERVRASHRGWDNLTLPVGHPFWQAHTPPNGWRCRCRIVSMSQAEYDKGLSPNGQPLAKEDPPEEFVEWKNKRTGEVMQLPKGVGPGFAYNPGNAVARNDSLARIEKDKFDSAPVALASAAVREKVNSDDFRRFYDNPSGSFPIGVISDIAASSIGAKVHTVQLSAETMIKQIRQHPELSAMEYAIVQEVIEKGVTIQDGSLTLIYLLKEEGYVTVVKATDTGKAVFMTSFRRISSDQAKRDREIRRLLEKEAGGGASQSAKGGNPT
ncbi:MAG: phage minor head protein [Sulfurimicrobium sp.]|nr:phage minor head protein [Sulfurimicrobium sp.]